MNFIRRNLTAYTFLLPWLIGTTVLGIIPLVISFYLSFTNYDFFQSPSWVGLKNYTQMFAADDRFYNSLIVTFTYVFGSVPLVLLLALSLAVALNKGIRGLAFFRSIYYVPSLLGGSVAIAVLWRQVFGREGVINKILDIFGIEGASWISSPDYAIYTLILLNVWQFGSPMVIFLAGLKQIPSELHEAASIDGAKPWTRFFRITLPLLTPIIFFNAVMQIISAMQAFTPAYIISGGTGGPLDSTLFYTLYLYQKAFNQFEMGYASALAWILLLMIALFTALLFFSSKKWVHYEE